MNDDDNDDDAVVVAVAAVTDGDACVLTMVYSRTISVRTTYKNMFTKCII